MHVLKVNCVFERSLIHVTWGPHNELFRAGLKFNHDISQWRVHIKKKLAFDFWFWHILSYRGEIKNGMHLASRLLSIT